jgi:hypothetical protein
MMEFVIDRGRSVHLDPSSARLLLFLCAQGGGAPAETARKALGGKATAASLDQLAAALSAAGLVSVAAVGERQQRLTISRAGRTALLRDWVPPPRGTLPMSLVRACLDLFREEALAATPPGGATDDEVLSAVLRIDAEQALHNYVPIYLLRERFAGRLDRRQLDARLFSLVESGRIRLSTLQDARLVTPEQYAAGIPSGVGGPRFFIVVQEAAPGPLPAPA